ncbi:hypothetical protein DUNSADRAFT_6441 [Dunaliella salina]|uniref:Uncharacterized protein n=1 Tax=Dunaliella salina TaxID=3046 RepID=A0ABQ7H6V5_DUNSA|nr:hypothetical protein DUNSADRAFT_6441 [Dunaliella salina]KAF5842591.1 hypothetical protein DUNSADRAFT_6441 [Dunaliella salina]|eukprot:KAF5842590.1 hypothetical protein DUNSADRAFT_6441 [Dunaliella salina]
MCPLRSYFAQEPLYRGHLCGGLFARALPKDYPDFSFLLSVFSFVQGPLYRGRYAATLCKNQVGVCKGLASIWPMY